MRSRRTFWTTLLLIGFLAAPSAGSAQDDPEKLPIGRFAADARGVFPHFKQDPAIASGISVTPENLPTWGLGAVFGAHWYPVRAGVVTFGIGAEMVLAGAGKTLAATSDTAEDGPAVNTTFKAFSPQVSFNFGKRNGFSYISGGIGSATYNAEREDAPLPEGGSGSKTINYGGGARWFLNEHLAFCVDLRFYAINPREADGARPALPRMTLMMLSAGVSFK